MFEGLTQRLGGIFDRLRGRGALTEADVTAALREVRIALLEADVALPALKDFLEKAQERAVGQNIIQTINPAQQVIKIVHDTLVEMLGAETVALTRVTNPPTVILMLGLQGSGKTTTSAKLAKYLSAQKQKVLLASLDTHRPAAQEQLAVLAKQIDVESLPMVVGEKPAAIARRAMDAARRQAADVLIVDTAGRLSVDDALMAELAEIRDISQPAEKLLVLDAMTGQDALTTAKTFHEKIGTTGFVLTRMDGDARGGAALSLRHATGQPIKFFGVGEKLDALDVFHPDRLAGRILGMGDVVSLVEKAAATLDQAEMMQAAQKLQQGQFDFDDLLTQIRQLKKMGGMKEMMGMLPGLGNLADKLGNTDVDERAIKHQEAIILSMTPAERRDVGVLNASRRRRIAAGAGVGVSDVNKVVKQYLMMRDTMKQMKKLGKKGFLRQMGAHGLGMGGKGLGGMPNVGKIPQGDAPSLHNDDTRR
ncbi:MAG: signal recognition particle protein [Alphaproteobacteria bacterium]|nr:signal recognition particle protein [Alphaproteobacteria bacterium]